MNYLNNIVLARLKAEHIDSLEPCSQVRFCFDSERARRAAITYLYKYVRTRKRPDVMKFSTKTLPVINGNIYPLSVTVIPKVNRSDARLIAEELYEIQLKEGIIKDDVLDINEVAEILHMSVAGVKKILNEIPHTGIGQKMLFFRSDLNKYLRR